MTAQSDLQSAIAREMETQGIKGWRFEMGGKHKKLIAPGHQPFVLPATTSDHRALHNALSDLRKAWGLKRVVCKNPANRRRTHRKRAESLPCVSSITPGKDPWAKLAPLAEQLKQPEAKPEPGLWERCVNAWRRIMTPEKSNAR